MQATEMAESPLHLLIVIMAAEKNASLHSNEVFVLQQFLSIYFVADVVTNIVFYYNELAYSCPIPQTYLRKYSLAQIGENVALELQCLMFDNRTRYSSWRSRSVKRGPSGRA